MNKDFTPSYLRRFIARLIDYFLVYSLCSEALPLFGTYLELHQEVLLAAATPFIFIPLESILIALFGTTIGKGICKIHILNNEYRKLSLLKSFGRSVLQALKIISFIIPLGSLFSKNFRRIFDIGLNSQVVKHHNSFSKFLIYASFAFICVFGPKTFENYLAPQSLISRTERGDFSAWVKFPIPEKSTKISFPGSPEVAKKQLKLPKGAKKLDYDEYFYHHESDDLTFAVSHTTLPKSILKWSSSLVLKGSLDLIKDNETKAKILKKQSLKVGKYPALDYQMEKNGLLSSGRLILVDDVLYKIDISFPNDQIESLSDMIIHFINSFEA